MVGPHAKLVIGNDHCGRFDDNDDDDNDWLVSRAANVKAAQVSCFAELPPVASGTSNCEQLRGWFVKYACNTRVSCPTRFLRSQQCAM